MGRVYYVFDKFSIIDILVGFILGFYLAFNHDSSNLWFDAIPFIILFAVIITLPVIIDVFLSKDKHKNEIPVYAILEAFGLNIAMITVCTAFGIVLGSFLIGNYITN